MNAIIRHLIQNSLIAIVCCFAGYLIGGNRLTTTFFLAIWLILWLGYHLANLIRLLRWLNNPKLHTVPHARGIWKNVFEILLSQAKSRKKRKQKLTQSLLRFNRAAEAMPNGVLIINRHSGRIEWFNPTAAEHLNLSQEFDENGILRNLIRAPEFQEFISRPLDERATTVTISVPKGHARQRTLAVYRAPFDKNDELLITEDISESEQLNATRRAFVANVSHELRTPLTVINGFLETLQDNPELPPKQRAQFIALMQQEGARMLNLLSDLLTLSRLENQSSRQSDEHERFNLSEQVSQLYLAGQQLSAGKHHISAEIASDLWFKGRQADLYSGLSNLVFNAVRYTPEGGNIHITLALDSEHPTQAHFSVRDNGNGIEAKHIPHLTERFYRVDKGRSRQSGGTGLGLAITKHALAEHDAILQIESTIGKGSTFSTTLAPILPPPATSTECNI